MKQTKTATKKPTSSKRRGSVRSRSSKRHIRISLHPVCLMIQLCVGVLLVASTISTSAVSTYDVHATVPADPLVDPAVITSITDGTHVVNQALTVEGTCPVPSYVKVYQNSVLAGVATCTVTGFSVSLLLSAGSNQIDVQDYNITDQIGPVGTPITVWYDAPIPPSPPPTTGGGSTSGGSTGSSGNKNNVVAPVTILSMQVDNNVPFVANKVQLTSQRPVFTGISVPFAKITITIHSDPVFCQTTANANGFWRCAVSEVLPVGKHSVSIVAVAPTGKVTKQSTFYIQAINEIPIDQTPHNDGPFTLTTKYNYNVHLIGENVPVTLIMSGGTSPYAITINWGDGTTSTILRASTSASNIEHTYKWINATVGSYTVKIQATDAAGHVAATQVPTTLRNPRYHGPASTIANNAGLTGLLTAIRAWLWLLWPAYIIIILMLISFWLGERKQLDEDRAEVKKMRKAAKKHKPRSHHV